MVIIFVACGDSRSNVQLEYFLHVFGLNYTVDHKTMDAIIIQVYGL